jgi:hypothetical protein
MVLWMVVQAAQKERAVIANTKQAHTTSHSGGKLLRQSPTRKV